MEAVFWGHSMGRGCVRFSEGMGIGLQVSFSSEDEYSGC